MENILSIKLTDLEESPWQGRFLNFGTKKTEAKIKEDIKQLAENIAENGLINPVIVRATGEKYEIIDGHRRVEAFRYLNKKNIPAIIRDIEDKEAQAQSVIANLQREDLSNIEKAIAFKKILASGIFSSKRELSKAIGKDETFIGDLLNTLKMDKRIIEDLLENKSTDDVRALRAIRKVEAVNDEQVSYKQWTLYQRFIKEKLSRAELFKIINNQKKSEAVNAFEVRIKPRSVQINFVDKISKEKREKLNDYITEQINNFLST